METQLSIAHRRFWSKVDKNGPIHPELGTRCWLWTAGTMHGYGWFRLCGKSVRAHTAVFMLIGKPVPENKLSCHRCNNRLCVRPDHLYHGDHTSNKADSIRSGTYVHGESHPRARLTEKDILKIRNQYAYEECSQRDLAKQFGVSSHSIAVIVRGEAWSHVGGPRMRKIVVYRKDDMPVYFSTQVVALFGVRGSGKDTVGDMIVGNYGFIKDSFAVLLKDMVKIAFPAFTNEDLYGPSKGREREYEQYPMGEDCLRCGRHLVTHGEGLICSNVTCNMAYPRYVTPRIALQTLGTEWGRRLYKNIWIDAGATRINEHIARNNAILESNPALLHGHDLLDYRFVFTDGRYDNEQARCAKLGWKTVLLLRKLDESTDAHSSEAELKTIPRERFSYILDNRCPLEELPALVQKMMADFKIEER